MLLEQAAQGDVSCAKLAGVQAAADYGRAALLRARPIEALPSLPYRGAKALQHVSV
jgi:hypothetical protein